MICVLEGTDACGKGTQADLLLKKANDVFSLEEYGLLKMPSYETQVGKLIESWLHGKVKLVNSDGSDSDFNSLGLQAAYQAGKLEYGDMIRRYHAPRRFLVLDRYWQSAVAYGAGVDGLDFDYMHRWGSVLPQADLNILLDVNGVDVIERQKKRGRKDRYEDGDIETMYKARNAYMALWMKMQKKEPMKWAIVDGSKSPAEVAKEIWTWVHIAYWNSQTP